MKKYFIPRKNKFSLIITLNLFIIFYANTAFAALTAKIGASATEVCVGQSITFHDASTGGPAATTWLWNFGTDASPATSSLKDPGDVTWSSPGVKVIRFDCDGGGGDNTDIITITVKSNSTAASSILPALTAICNGSNITLNRNGGILGSNASWKWYSGSCGGTLVGSGDNITVSPSSTTTYFLRAEGDCNNTACVQKEVTVNSLPTIYNVLSSSTSYCEDINGVSIYLNGSELGVNYQLFKNGFSVSTLPGDGDSITWVNQTNGGPYTIVATNASSCSQNMNGAIAVNEIPLPTAFNVGGSATSYCAGTSGVTVFLDGSQTGVSYQLKKGGSNWGAPLSGTGDTLKWFNQTSGNYTITATTNTGGCTQNMTGSHAVNVVALPVIYNVTSTATAYCADVNGVSIYLNGSELGVNYQLFKNGFSVSTLPGDGDSITWVNQTNGGPYTIVATNASSCSQNMNGAVSVTVIPLPTAFNVGGSATSYCAGTPGVTVFLDGSQTGVSYQLLKGGSNWGAPFSGTGDTLMWMNQTGWTYTIEATTNTGGCSQTMTGNYVVTENPLPLVYNVSSSATNFCTGSGGVTITLSNSTSGIEYQLLKNGNPEDAALPGDGNPLAWNNMTAGTYTIEAKNTTTSCSNMMNGSAVITENPLPILYNVTASALEYCTGSSVSIYLQGSQSGANFRYQLRKNGIDTTAFKTGTGGILTWSNMPAGTYTVMATNTTSNCTNLMNDSAEITQNPLPIQYTLTESTSSFCEGINGVTLTLSGSESSANFQYQLLKNGNPEGAPKPGANGSQIQWLNITAGSYEVRATNTTTGCQRMMSGNPVITQNPAPTVFNVGASALAYCESSGGVTITLSGSTIGINYQLLKNGSPEGMPLPGNGGALAWNGMTIGTYTVEATNTTSLCNKMMNGSAIITENPLPAQYNLTASALTYCEGTSGITLTLNRSQSSTNFLYQLFNGANPEGSPKPGADDDPILWPNITAGSYTVVATNTPTSCQRTMNGNPVITQNPAPAVFNVGPSPLSPLNYCTGSAGATITLDGSTTGVNYQLLKNGNPEGIALAGNGAAQNWPNMLNGPYTVRATNVSTSCTKMMNGSQIINPPIPLPNIYTLSSSATEYCSGSSIDSITLSNSQTGISYQLLKNNTPLAGQPILTGTGSRLKWSNVVTGTGNITVSATNITYGCTQNMIDIPITEKPLPTTYNLTAPPAYCEASGGVRITLNNSNTGTSYQLYKNDTLQGSPMPGNNAALNWDNRLNGSYKVIATLNGCTNQMNGNPVVVENPRPLLYNVTASALEYCAGSSVTINLQGSQLGSNYRYQLSKNGIDTAAFKTGTGGILTWNNMPAGAYTVMAANTTTGCQRLMAGSPNVTMNPLPVVNFTLNPIYNINSAPYLLVGTPSGGTFTGPGVIQANNTFYPNLAGVGTHTIAYTYTTPTTGCIGVLNRNTSVLAASGAITGFNKNKYCSFDAWDTIRGINPTGADGWFSIVPDTAQLVQLANDYAIFKPNSVRGNVTITYSYIDTTGGGATQFNIDSVRYVDHIGTVDFVTLAPEYCANAGQVTLNALFSHPNGSGQFTGPSSGFLVNPALNQALLFPSQLLPNNTYQISFVYTSAISGCQVGITKSTTIHGLPVITTTVPGNVLCGNAPPIVISATPTNGSFTGPNLSQTGLPQGQIRFTPTSGVVGNNNIIYTVTDNNNCENKDTTVILVNPFPLLRINRTPTTDICVNDPEVQITGTVDNSFNAGNFYGNGVVNGTPNDGLAVFLPNQVTPNQPITIYFTYTNNYGCNDTIDSTVIAYSLPTVTLTGINLSGQYCNDAPEVTMQGNPSGGTYTVAGVSGAALNKFNPINFAPGQFNVSYYYQDNHGCENTYLDTITINALPEPNFTISDECIADTIYFVNQTTSADTILQWLWNFADPTSGTADTSSLTNPGHKYSNAGTFGVRLYAKTNKGCDEENSNSITLGSNPTANFSWSNECFGTDSTRFQNNSTGGTLSQFYWDFGDGTTSTQQNPVHNYTSVASYPVELIIVSVNNCRDTVQKLLHVRPFINTYPYFQNFESGNGGWIGEVINGDRNSWEIGTPTTAINHAYSGTNCIATKLNDNYNPNENSALISPCFDFSQLKNPIIKFYIWNVTESNKDGAVMQYSNNGGADWHNLGDIDDGINWYNATEILSAPGTSAKGWSGQLHVGWVEARHHLRDIIGYDNVRLRVAFASDNVINLDGFAIDDIWIGEHNKMVMLEHFTNSSSDQSATIDPALNQMIAERPLTVMAAHYHTNFPGADPFNAQNPLPSANRTFYYGISTIPVTVMDGNQYNNGTASLVNNTSIIEKRALADPLFAISLQKNVNGSNITVNATITANQNITAHEITAHILLVEKLVTTVTGNNGQIRFENVVRSMLPNSAGITYNTAWAAGSQQQISVNGTLSGFINPAVAEAMLFLQNEETKEIYQAATTDSLVPVYPGIFENTQADNFQFVIYPNPASEVLNIAFNQPTQQQLNLQILNYQGVTVEEQTIPVGTDKITMYMQRYTKGIYFVRIFDTKNQFLGLKKVIVL